MNLERIEKANKAKVGRTNLSSNIRPSELSIGSKIDVDTGKTTIVGGRKSNRPKVRQTNRVFDNSEIARSILVLEEVSKLQEERRRVKERLRELTTNYYSTILPPSEKDSSEYLKKLETLSFEITAISFKINKLLKIEYFLTNN